ncbi:nitroreductase family deazaflavin-dependent oxidoreductase [Actinomadura hibisca]|uniref:nitroreductase family deazaflavin-dependent oxidoreductase n=1 Tax=Actinomadura hibisca TaxID=68565 RepID=UPI000A56A907|nr:nitroreductase family deazaflavin-dependent oxidoreductase [Actinomadura hibisca]
MPKPRPGYLDQPRTAQIMKYGTVAHVALYQATGGALGRRFRLGSRRWRGAPPVCLLTTVGRKSGRHRTVPLLYLADAERVVLVASQSGLPRHPAWYHNLVANPNVLAQVRRYRRPMRARTADAAERAALWPRLVEMYPDFTDYEAWTEREIPVVICEPA